MSVRVVVGDEEHIAFAIRRFRKAVASSSRFRRSWYKTRFGYFEKPGVRRRRKKNLVARNRRLLERGHSALRMYMGLRHLFEHEATFPPP